jgi:competence protein ComEC
LDVGQGLSVVVQTGGEEGKHVLVYDTGPGYPSGFNMGDAVLVPYLRSKGISKVNTLVISHGDKDHSGGVHGLMKSFLPEQLFYGETPVLGEQVVHKKALTGQVKSPLFSVSSKNPDEVSMPGNQSTMAGITKERLCQSGDRWQWGHVSFQFLHPPRRLGEQQVMSQAQSGNNWRERSGAFVNSNNLSCVLQINFAGQTVLLPGDIESIVEHQLLGSEELIKPVTVLVAAHHGSKSSSSPSFVHAIEPENVVFSAGYRHHFGHPAREVVKRYTRQNSQVWNTADQGALEFQWDERGNMSVLSARSDTKRYWY